MRTKLILIALLALAVGLGIKLYGNSLIQKEKVETLTKAAATTQERLKSADIADAGTQDKKRKALDSARPTLIQGRKFNEAQKRPDGADDAAFGGVLNSAIDAANASIESAQRLP